MAVVMSNSEIEEPGNEVKPGKILRCPQEGCGKEFRSSPGYRYHLKSHALDPRPHVCQCCHKKFKSANGLKYHLRKAHHIEPVLAKQNLGPTSPKGSDSMSPEGDHYIPLNESYPRGFINGYGNDRTAPSPIVKSPLGLPSPLLKNLPCIPSPLLKSPMNDIPPYLSNSSNGAPLQSPYGKVDKYAHYFSKSDNMHRMNHSGGDYNRSRLNSDYNQQSAFHPRSSLSEYTQQCQQANNEFRQQCQRLSCDDLQPNRLSTTESYCGQHSSCDLYSCCKDKLQHCSSGSFSSDYNSHSIDSEPPPSTRYCLNSDRIHDYPSPLNKHYFKDFPLSNERRCQTLHDEGNNCVFSNRSRSRCDSYNSDQGKFRTPCSLQNTEQIVPDISVPNGSPSNISSSCDRNNNHNKPMDNLRGTSESSTETELSDCVFQNENSNHSPPPSCNQNISSKISDSTVASGEDSKIFLDHRMQPPPKPLLSRRTSRSKSIPQLTINPSVIELSDKTKDSKDSNKLLHLAEVATSPKSPFHPSPLPLSLTPSLLPESTPDWVLKSPLTKFAFPDKPFLSTPTIGRTISESNHVDSPITTSNSLPPSPFLENVQTPSFWPSQVWPTPVWLCFLKGCTVKFEQDDKEFRTSEEISAFCTTPGGRRRDDMNFYTSGMKIVGISEEKPNLAVGRDMVNLTFEQVIPGTQRLVAKCPIDHPFYIRHKGWSASNPTEAMARYGIPFRAVHTGDIVVPASSNKLNPTTGMSPIINNSGPQIFTFSHQDTARFSQAKKTEHNAYHDKPYNSISSSSLIAQLNSITNASPNQQRSQETITLTYSKKSPTETSSTNIYPPKHHSNEQKLLSELRTISENFKKKTSIHSVIQSTADTESYSDGEGDLKKEDSSEDLISPNKEMVLPNKVIMKEENLQASKIKAECDEEQKIDINSNHIITLCSQSSEKENEQAGKEKNKKPRKSRRKPFDDEEVKRRPMNGFMLFAKTMRVELSNANPGNDNRAISRLLGEKWKELTEEKREQYSQRAKELADERMKKNPDCWKRKNKKEKETSSMKSEASDNMETEQKRQKLEHPNEVVLPTGFAESQPFIKPEPQTYVSQDSQPFLKQEPLEAT